LYIDEDVLVIASPFFKREIEQQKSEDIPTIVCSGKKVHDMVSLLKCIHPNVLTKVNGKHEENIFFGNFLKQDNAINKYKFILQKTYLS